MKNISRLSTLSEIEYQRLYPRVTNPNFLVLRSRRLIFQKWISTIGGTLKVLDVGGRYQPYRRLFENRAGRYIACDLLQTELVNVVSSGELLPFAANTFDVAIATQVFEYFAKPKAAADEICSVLKPGGVLLMSVASCAPRFVDEERWRFTPGGIRAVLGSFGSVEIVPETYSIGGLLRTVNLGMHTFMHYSLLRKLYGFSICPCLNLVGLALECAHLSRNDQFAPNYSVFARK
jgi:SAM-dependent methyltransferase